MKSDTTDDKDISVEEDQNSQIIDLLGDEIDDETITKDEDEKNEGKTSEEEDNSDSEEEDEEEDKTDEDKEDKTESADEELNKNEEEEDDKTDDDELDLKEQNKILLEKIENLSKDLLNKDTVSSVDDKKEVKDIIDETLNEDFIGDLDIDDVSSDKELFNEVLLKVATKIEARLENKYKNSMSKDVKQYTETHIELKDMVKAFYNENTELIGVESTVQAAAVDVIKNNPDMKLIDVFNTAADNAREMLGIKKIDKKIVNKDTDKKKSTALVKKTQSVSKQKAVKTSKLQNQIDDLL